MRFFYVASFNAMVVAVWTALILIPELNMSKIIAGGSAGGWFFVGYAMLAIVGCAGILSCGTIHYVLSTIKNTTSNNAVSWLGLIVWEVGTVGSTWLLGVSGFVGGNGLLNGLSTSEIHGRIVIYALPVEIFTGVAVLGFLISVVNIYVALTGKAK